MLITNAGRQGETHDRLRAILLLWRQASPRRKDLFQMNDRMQDVMAEATRLTRTGRLAEATAMLQRTLTAVPATTISEVDTSRADAPVSYTHLTLPTNRE